MFHEHVVELSDEQAGQLVFVRLLGDDRPPRPAEVVDEAGKGNDQGFAEQGGLRAEMTEQQRLDDAGGLGDLSSSGAAVVLACEEIAGGVEKESPGLASGTTRRPGRCPCRRSASWSKVAGTRSFTPPANARRPTV